MVIASFALLAVERVSPPELRHPDLVGGVMIYGLAQLDPAAAGGAAPFIERWQAAMSFHLGAEDFEKFCLARQRKPQ